MASLLTADDYPEIRAALDVSLSEAELPNAVIGRSIYVGAAMDEVIARYPTAESETDPKKIARLKRAAVLLAAARLAPAIVRITSLAITQGDRNWSRQTFDPEQRAAELRAMAEQELSALLEPGTTAPTRPPMFALASGRRGA